MKLIVSSFLLLSGLSALAQTSKTPSGGGSSGTSYVRNGVSTPVSQDTTTPANSRPLPVAPLNTSGVQVDPATAQRQDTGNTSLSAIQTSNGAIQTSNSAIQTSNAAIQTSNASIDGKLTTTANGLKVDGSAVTQPVSMASAPLPTGGATAARQDTGNTSLSSIDTKTPALVTGRVPVDGSAVTQPISAAALPLPAGASTETTLAAMSAKVPNLGQALKAASQPVVLASDQGAIASTSATITLTTTSAAAVNADLVPSVDVSGYSTVFVQIAGTFSATISFQGSEDNTNFVSVNAQSVSASTQSALQTTVAAGVYLIPVQAKYLRVRVTAYTSGTVTGTATATAQPIQDMGLRSVGINGTVAISSAVPATVTLTSTAVTVGTTAVRLVASGTTPASTRRSLTFVADTGNAGNCVYGSGAVTISSGTYAYPGAITRFENDANDYFAICDTAAQTIRVTEGK